MSVIHKKVIEVDQNTSDRFSVFWCLVLSFMDDDCYLYPQKAEGYNKAHLNLFPKIANLIQNVRALMTYFLKILPLNVIVMNTGIQIWVLCKY